MITGVHAIVFTQDFDCARELLGDALGLYEPRHPLPPPYAAG